MHRAPTITRIKNNRHQTSDARFQPRGEKKELYEENVICFNYTN